MFEISTSRVDSTEQHHEIQRETPVIVLHGPRSRRIRIYIIKQTNNKKKISLPSVSTAIEETLLLEHFTFEIVVEQQSGSQMSDAEINKHQIKLINLV